MTDELEDALEELYQSGSLESTGSFRLSAEKAREKLSQSLFSNPASYILCLYSAGYMAGAQEFHLEVGIASSFLGFKGAHFDKTDLLDIFAHLLIVPESGQDWALKELALGLHTAPTAGVKAIQVRTREGRLVVKDGKTRFVGAVDTALDGVQIVIEHGRALWQSIRAFLNRGHLPELFVLRTSLCPMGKSGTMVSGPHRWAWPNENSKFEPWLVGKVESGVVGLGAQGGLGSGKKSELLLSIRGRAFRERMRAGKERVTAEIRADHLALDLSQSAPLRSSEYLTIRRRITEKVCELREELLLSEEHKISEKERRFLSRQVTRNLRSAGALNKALSILQTMPFSYSRRASVLHLLGRTEQAKALLLESLSRENLPRGLRPSRLFDLAIYQARLKEREAFDTWQKGYDSVVEEHRERKGHLVADALEKKILWLSSHGADTAEAWGLWRQARELKAQLGQEHPRMAVTLELGAALRLAAHEFEEALDLAQRAHSIRLQTTGLGNPAVGPSLSLKALALKDVDSQQAFETALQRWELMQAVYGPEHPETAASHNLLALCSPGPAGQEHFSRAHQVFQVAGIPQMEEGRVIVCFRAWFHTRSPWQACWPLTWGAT